MRRRDFLTLLGGAASWPLVARAAAGDAGDRISWERIARTRMVAAFRQGLQDTGYVEGENVAPGRSSQSSAKPASRRSMR